jgi:putative addiction module component (TIGR02574 family)
MDTLVEELAARAKTLSPQDRARLADELLASLQGEPDADTDASWADEIGRRVAEIQSGSAKLTAAEDVHAQARRLYQR